MATTIPMDVIHSYILPQLPVKTLTRFKSVSKSWQTIISSREFIHLHHQHTLSSDANRLIIFVNWRLKLFHVRELDSPFSPPLNWDYDKLAHIPIDIVASSEYFLLLNLYPNYGLILLNPSTGKYYKIPYPNYQGGVKHYGMYLDVANNDYKVVGITNTDVEVYSLRTNAWKINERSFDNSYRILSNVTAVIRHLLHILFVPASFHEHHGKRIGCFDILAEKWINDVPFPHVNDLERIKLTVLDGLLCVTGVDKGETRSRNYVVWVMKEYGVIDSWFKLISIGFDESLYSDIDPIVFRKGSQDEVLCRRFSMYDYIWYDVKYKKVTTADVLNGVIPRAIIGSEGNYAYTRICKGSLVDFPGGQQAEQTTRSSKNYLSF